MRPVVTIGKNEITEALTQETREALKCHELIKVKMLESCTLDRHEVAAQLADACEAEVAQILGRTFLLYKRAESPKLELPSAGAAKSPRKAR